MSAEPARITAILNCFGSDGANVSQLLLRADGRLTPFGDVGTIRLALHALFTSLLTAAPLAEPIERQPLAALPLKRPRGRPRKARPPETADGAE